MDDETVRERLKGLHPDQATLIGVHLNRKDAYLLEPKSPPDVHGVLTYPLAAQHLSKLLRQWAGSGHKPSALFMDHRTYADLRSFGRSYLALEERNTVLKTGFVALFEPILKEGCEVTFEGIHVFTSSSVPEGVIWAFDEGDVGFVGVIDVAPSLVNVPCAQ